ncbi:MAG: PAS domain S-box protein, partial [Desulfobacterales bacterium]
MKNKTSSLRKRAEEFLKKYPDAIKEITTVDVNKLVEDLHVHQIELEIQNEELRRAQSELEVSRDGYSDLYDFAPVGYVTISEKGLILQANLACADMLGVERSSLIGKPFSRFVKKEDQDVFYLHRKTLFEKKAKQVCELKLIRKDRTQFHAQLECILNKDTQGNITQTRTAISDISERKRVEEVLRNAHTELERRVEDRTGELVEANEELKTEIEERKRVELELREALSEIKQLK